MRQLTHELKNRKAKFMLVAIIGVLMLVALFAPIPVAAASPQARTIEINARQYAYSPETLVVNRGDTITLHLESFDAAHGLFVDGYDVNIQAEPGKSAVVTFVADKAGKFKFRCSIPCGTLHPFMIGELNVEPNAPLVRALAATLIIAIGAVIYFWKQ
jgi:heme/copper-type cytochrome/quinol oxidase subunit 2